MTDELLRAHRELDLVAPTEVVAWAVSELAQGRTEPTLVDLAATWETSAESVDGLLDVHLVSQGLRPPTTTEAGRLVALFLAGKIVEGDLAPYDGARAIWSQIALAVPEAEPELRGFIGLASEWEDDEQHRPEYEADILVEARRYIREGDSTAPPEPLEFGETS